MLLEFKVCIDARIPEHCVAEIVKGTDKSNKAHGPLHFIVEIFFIDFVYKQSQASLPALILRRILEVGVKPMVHFIVKTVGGFAGLESSGIVVGIDQGFDQVFIGCALGVTVVRPTTEILRVLIGRQVKPLDDEMCLFADQFGQIRTPEKILIAEIIVITDVAVAVVGHDIHEVQIPLLIFDANLGFINAVQHTDALALVC